MIRVAQSTYLTPDAFLGAVGGCQICKIWHSFATCIPGLADLICCAENISARSRVYGEGSIKNMGSVMQGSSARMPDSHWQICGDSLGSAYGSGDCHRGGRTIDDHALQYCS